MLPLLLAASLTAVLGPLPDPKPTYGSAPRPTGSEVKLSYVADAGFATAVELSCDPPGGGHPKPVEACATLARVDADPDRIKPATTACILLYKPVTAELSGVWQGRVVSWKHRYGNTCEMRRATGELFRF
ncbi:serine protease [Actinoplanes sp. LDG1-06]|uniref:Serine protease n=1 Tax=Paractinoplanes ovalisporus TaxID=2810368 RepID=A0ABS2A5X4_9ACTN|nr:SSI family serine proteinase inhibitor [Actinoplanes ovalisporus]MBM2615247.1 serine protease [Actinoplanes ovalisporus]